MRLVWLAVIAVSFLPLSASSKEKSKAPTIATTLTHTSETFGDWAVERFNDGTTIASTQNPSGSRLIIFCDKSCSVIFDLNIPCDVKGEFAALINTPDRAFNVNLKCETYTHGTVMSTELTQPILDSIDIGGQFGIAVPLKNGEFSVSRFSLTGAKVAVQRAFELSPARTSGTLKPVPGDIKL